MTIETLKSPNPRNRDGISVIKSKLLSVSSMPFSKSLTRDVTSYWQADCTTDFLADTFPPCTERRCVYTALSNSKRGPDSFFPGFGAIAAYGPKTRKKASPDPFHENMVRKVYTAKISGPYQLFCVS